jgi:hypothetical protein
VRIDYSPLIPKLYHDHRSSQDLQPINDIRSAAAAVYPVKAIAIVTCGPVFRRFLSSRSGIVTTCLMFFDVQCPKIMICSDLDGLWFTRKMNSPQKYIQVVVFIPRVMARKL